MIGQSRTQAPGAGGRRPGIQYLLGAALILALWALTVATFIHPDSMTLSHRISFNVAVTTAALLASMGAAYFVMTEFMLYGRLTSFLVGAAFLTFAAANGGVGLLPLLDGTQGVSPWIPYSWAVQRIVGAALLCVAPLVVTQEVVVPRRRNLVSAAVLLALFFAALVYFWAIVAPSTHVPRVFQIVLELVACSLLFTGSGLFWHGSRTGTSPWFVGLSLTLAIAGFAELQYAIQPYATSTAQLGDLLRLTFYAGILLILAAGGSRGYRRLRWQTRELTALHALMTPPVVHDVAAVTQHVVDVVGESLQGSAQIILAEKSRSHHSSLSEIMLGTEDYAPKVMGADVQRITVGTAEGLDGREVLGVPLKAGGRHIGMLIIDHEEPREFSPEDRRLLGAFGVQASVLLERSQLYEELAAGAVIEERARLAREIHDGLAQHLAFLKMRVAWLKRSPAALDVGQLIDIEGVLETALIEARQAITTLRSEPQGTSTVDAIAAYASEFGQVSGLRVQVEADHDAPEVGPKARVELLRIVQEALNNVRKHARASTVDICMRAADGGTEILIVDNGGGFTPKEQLHGHFGMEIMSERAESIGGSLSFTSTPGSGTEVRVWAPRQDAVSHSSDSQTA